MALISITRVVTTSVIHRKTVSSGKKVASCKTVIKARTRMFLLKLLITVRIIWTEVVKTLQIIVAKIERSKSLFAFNIDKVPITGNCGNVEEVGKFVHRKVVSVLRVLS